ncbi:cytochrome C [Sulfurimonas sp.]|uniref:cytochrome C n=1 Tax=Sulfurimonas sp. TaxID=2022749 RepID=UPI003566E4BC
MNKLLKLVLASVMVLAVSTTAASADVAKGQKLYLKKLKGSCGMNGAKMSTQHSQSEWETFKEEGKLADELKKICPKAPSKALQEKYLEHYYDFFFEYANDSGNVPSC